MTYFHQILTFGTVLRLYDSSRGAGLTTLDDYFTIMPPRWSQRHYTTDLMPGYRSGRVYRDDRAPAIKYLKRDKSMGRRVRWTSLPLKVQDFAREIFPQYAPLARR